MTVEKSMTRTVPQKAMPKVLPLENGDRLTRHEFERRYQATGHIKKAELIEGVVYVASPLRFEPHAEPHGTDYHLGWVSTTLSHQERDWVTMQRYAWIWTTNHSQMHCCD
jgi:hypothetical protein